MREESAVKFRQFNPMVDENPKCTEPGFRWLINGLGWDDIAEYPELGTTEVWSFFNLSPDVHPIHLHLVQFQILDRQKLQPDPARPGFFLPLTLPGTQPIAPEPNEAGWKDTFRSMPEVTGSSRDRRLYRQYPPLPYYRHEDHEMMRQFRGQAELALSILQTIESRGNHMSEIMFKAIGQVKRKLRSRHSQRVRMSAGWRSFRIQLAWGIDGYTTSLSSAISQAETRSNRSARSPTRS
jgi:hypothetical protein